MDNSIYVNFLYAAILAGIPLIYGTVGEIISQKAGNLNLGVEGMMYLGAIGAFIGAYHLDSITFSILLSIILGGLGALIYSLLTVTFKADQNVIGLTLTIFGTGVANSIGSYFVKTAINNNVTISDSIRNVLQPIKIIYLSNIPVLGKLLFQHNLFFYFAIIIAMFFSIYLNHTRFGLNLRAIGENPSAADAAGINVFLYKYIHIIISGCLSGLAGAYIILITCGGTWTYNAIAGQGWIAVALVIFCKWKPINAIYGSILFGTFTVLRLYIPKSIIAIEPSIMSMLPFAFTSLILIISSIKIKKDNMQPASCGINYFREER